MRLTVIGTGYLGATHAACMAELGHEVLAVDTDQDKIAVLRQGRTPFFEPGLDDLIRTHTASGKLRFTTSYRAAAEFGDVFFSCVGTPQQPDSDAADLRYVNAVIEELGPLLDRPVLVVGKSTVPVGTARRLADRLAELAPVGAAAELAWNPEFLREGFAVRDTLTPDRLVYGIESANARALLDEVYAPVAASGTPVIVTDFATAELVKTAANSFLATKISFINAMAEVCETAGGDVTALAEAIGHDDRIGGKFLRAGIGFGGGCLPKDIRAFRARADELGIPGTLGFLREVDSINSRRRTRVVDLAEELLAASSAQPAGDGGPTAPLNGRSVTVLGAAFKPDSDDIRDSPALHIANELHLRGASVTVYDPQAMTNARSAAPVLKFAESSEAAVRNAELVLLLTEWQEFRDLDPAVLRERVTLPLIIDGRNALDADRWRAAGWQYHAPGRPGPQPDAVGQPVPRPAGAREPADR